ncbi:cell division protein DivIB [Philodulcilactobacillus myokoensis]|uniref:Cell division protein DivIB n=1 Tax=Philodulcilactobacillus myokoensis TaxID=2929573 RepID=A0A9W6B196_9LACO|nr:cell division protein FtsQ/DivIB [Philodulcilactobacillus myokoensis]GLB47022.1 cell division protein DivIB [Philodulcilactobacillus myokoensis]
MKWQNQKNNTNPIPSLSKQLSNHGYENKISQNLPGFQSERHNRLIKKIVINLSIFIIIILIMFYFISPLSKIASIKIRNQNQVSKKIILNHLEISKGDSIFKFITHRNKIERNIYSFDPYVKKLHLKIRSFNHIDVQSDEYYLTGYLFANHNYYPIMNNGRIDYQPIANHDNKLPVLVNFHSSNALHKLINQYQKLPNSIKKNIVKIEYAPSNVDDMRIHLIMRDGNQIYAKIDTLAYKMSYYFSIAKSLKKTSIINFEVGAYSYPQK